MQLWGMELPRVHELNFITFFTTFLTSNINIYIYYCTCTRTVAHTKHTPNHNGPPAPPECGSAVPGTVAVLTPIRCQVRTRVN